MNWMGDYGRDSFNKPFKWIITKLSNQDNRNTLAVHRGLWHKGRDRSFSVNGPIHQSNEWKWSIQWPPPTCCARQVDPNLRPAVWFTSPVGHITQHPYTMEIHAPQRALFANLSSLTSDLSQPFYCQILLGSFVSHCAFPNDFRQDPC